MRCRTIRFSPSQSAALIHDSSGRVSLKSLGTTELEALVSITIEALFHPFNLGCSDVAEVVDTATDRSSNRALHRRVSAFSAPSLRAAQV